MADAGIAPFVVLDPKCIPTGPLVPSSVEPRVHAALLRLHRDVGLALRAGRSVDGAVAVALDELPVPDVDPPSEDGPIYDRCFGLARAVPRPAAAALVYARSVALALQRYQFEARGDAGAWRSVGTSVLDMLGRFLHLPPEPAPAAASEAGGPAAADALRRWVHAHQILAVVDQGTLWALQGFEFALMSQRPARAEALLQLAAALVQARGAVLGFAGQPSQAALQAGLPVRVSAGSLPEAPEHRQLTALLERLRPPLDVARRLYPRTHAALQAALAQRKAGHAGARGARASIVS